MQVGVPPAVGSDYGHFKVLGGGVRVRLTRGVIIQVIPPHRSTEYADQTVTGRSRGAGWRKSVWRSGALEFVCGAFWW